MSASPRTTPRQRIEAECARRGREAVVGDIIDLLAGRDVDDEFLVELGNLHATAVLAGRDGGPGGYWPRVWAARGLLYAWGEEATAPLVAAASDPAWRVREMVAKVVARHRIDDAFEAVVALRTDPVPRVRRAAERALVALAGTD